MNKGKRYFRTFLALLLIAGCSVAGVAAPGETASWYDRQTLGKVEYADMEYKPYQISYFDSFAEKIKTLAVCQTGEEVRTYVLELGEYKDMISDKKLQELVNNELAKLYNAGFFPERPEAESLLWRDYLECCMIMKDKGGENRRSIYVWSAGFEVDGGTLIVQMDSEYHKLYSIRLSTEEKGELGTNGCWPAFLNGDTDVDIPEIWMDYWGLTDAVYSVEYADSDGAVKKSTPKTEYMQPYRYFLVMPDSNSLEINYDVFFFQSGWSFSFGVQMLNIAN